MGMKIERDCSSREKKSEFGPRSKSLKIKNYKKFDQI